jgi:hypothetical protein
VRRANGWIALGMIAIGLTVSACGSSESAAPSEPAQVTKLAGGAIRITLTADAAKRIDLKTAPVQSDGGATVIPYEAVLYDPDGAAWTYTSPKPLVFQRADITVESIDGKRAVLSQGPAAGTAVVTVGATELWGVEYGGIEED